MSARSELVAPSGITGIGVEGFKSIRDPQDIRIAPLTVLAGVNSSGKSSIIQPLLLLKQTLEAPYDPGPLLLDGPNVSVTKIEQILSHAASGQDRASSFTVKLGTTEGADITFDFSRSRSDGIEFRLTAPFADRVATFREGILDEQLVNQLATSFTDVMSDRLKAGEGFMWRIVRDRWSLRAVAQVSRDPGPGLTFSIGPELEGLEQSIAGIIHLPALRGNPERTYRTVAVEDYFPGVFNNYTAGVISAWQNRSDADRLTLLHSGMERLGLSWTVVAQQHDDARVELQVGRLPRSSGGKRDLVNIADVGFGVSQTLPVIVALLAASTAQLVYLEQPEIHLHPRAQAEFAHLLAEAVDRGIRVIVETHSSLLLRAIQTLVARGRIEVDDVVLHWFSRDPDTGYTTITSAELDRAGSFGDWPEDFDEVNLRAEHDYLTAAESAEDSA
jgi:hypothetical protein